MYNCHCCHYYLPSSGWGFTIEYIASNSFACQVRKQSWTLGGQRPLTFSHLLQVGDLESIIDCRDYKNLWIILSSESAARTEGPGLETPFSSSLKVSKKPLTRDPLNGIGTFESRRKQPRVDPKKRIGERLDPSAKKEETDEEEIEEVATTLRPRKTRE